MKKLLSIILSIIMLFSLATAAFANEADKTITVGINAQFPPFEYRDENDKLTGFDIDLMNYIGERIGFEIEYKEFPFDRLLPAVASGEVDCAISAITITEERDGVVDYTIPYLSSRVTHIDGEASDMGIEQYAIVFSNYSAEKGKIAEAAGEPETSLYNLFNNAISDLIEDKTIEKLGEKYKLNKAADTDDFDYEYTVVPVPDDFWKTNMDNNELSSETKTSVTSVPYSDWARADIQKAIALNIINVGENYNYNFPAPITREEFCNLIYNYCANVIGRLEPVQSKSNFTDTDNSRIKVLNEAGIINGKSETEFAPNDLLTREEAAVILSRMVNKTIPVPVTKMYFKFDDEASISDWASDSIQVMCNMGVMKGVGENKFAPQDVYTTEQAIATIVRVYAAQSANSGIIGGADNTTEIVVTNTIEIDDFYVDEAIRLVTESGELATDKDFISLYTANDEMTDKILALGDVDFSKPTDIFYLSADRAQIAANLKAMAEAEGVDIEEMGDAWLNHLWKRLNFSNLASLINSSYGSENLAALTILVNNRGYIMPKDFKNNFALFIQYEGDYSAIVSFYEYGDGVISANMSFVKNGDKDNVFRRIHEITQGLGENSIDVAIVK